MARPSGQVVPLTGFFLDGLTQGSAWLLDGSRTLTYSFWNTDSSYYWDPAVKATARSVFNTLEQYIAVSFVEVTPGGTVYDNTWKALPKDLPPRSTVWEYLDLWDWDGTLERIHHALYVEVRENAGREASPTTAIIDSQTAKGAVKGGLRSTRPAMTLARRCLAASATF